MRWVGNVLLYTSTVIAAVSVIVYHGLSGGRWAHSQEGRHVMAYMASIALILTTWMIGVVFEVPHWFDTVRLCVFATLPIVLTWRLVLIVRAQLNPEPEETS